MRFMAAVGLICESGAGKENECLTRSRACNIYALRIHHALEYCLSSFSDVHFNTFFILDLHTFCLSTDQLNFQTNWKAFSATDESRSNFLHSRS